MSTPSAEILEHVNGLVRRYRSGFAGQPRITRSTSELESILQDLASHRGDIDPADANAAEARKQIDALEESWKSELKAIHEAQSVGDDVRALQSIEQWFGDTMGRYQRNFAGKNRVTRDLGMLNEITNDLSWLKGRVQEVAAAYPEAETAQLAGAIDRNHDMAKSEQDAIRKARRQGSANARASGLAQLANNQFERYRLHFAGKPRGSRRQETLAAIVWALKNVQDEMLALQGAPADPHQKNIQIVTRRLHMYREELAAIVDAVDSMTSEGRNLALGDAANQLMAAYRDNFAGKSRKDADAEFLNGLWEQLWAVAREMDDLEVEEKTESMARNLQLVRDTLRMFAREHQAIVEAQEGVH